MADGRFGCEADTAGPAAGSTRSLVTHCDMGRPSFQCVNLTQTEWWVVENIALGVRKSKRWENTVMQSQSSGFLRCISCSYRPTSTEIANPSRRKASSLTQNLLKCLNNGDANGAAALFARSWGECWGF